MCMPFSYVCNRSICFSKNIINNLLCNSLIYYTRAFRRLLVICCFGDTAYYNSIIIRYTSKNYPSALFLMISFLKRNNLSHRIVINENRVFIYFNNHISVSLLVKLSHYCPVKVDK